MRMLVCHTPEGRISNIVFDPIPPEMLEHYVASGIPHIVVESDLDGAEIITKCYVENGELLWRPEFDAPDEIDMPADGIVHATIELPDPCEITVDGEVQTILGGVLELASDMPAEYFLELRQWPYIVKNVKVTAHATV